MQSDHQQQQGSAVASQEPLGSTVDCGPANDSANRVGSDLEQKRDELAHSLAMLRATLDATMDGILVTDSQRRVTAFNQQYCRMWNVPRSVLEQGDHNPALQLVAQSFGDPEAFLRGIDRIYNEAPPDTFDIQYLKDGRIYERSTRLQCVEGKSVGRVWCFRDVTEHRRSTEALREETRILDLLNKTGSTIAADLDLDTLVQSVTDLATQISGAKFGAFFYNSFDRNGESYVLYTLSGADRSAFEHFGHPRATPLFGPTFRGEGPIRSDDVLQDPRYGQFAPHHGMPGGHLPVRSYLAVSVVSRTGEVIGGLFFGHPEPGVFTARTERLIAAVAAQAAVAIDNARLYDSVKRAVEGQELLLEAERTARADAERASLLKDEFLATLSHELRTPLNAILGWANLLRTRKHNEERLREGLTVIERNARVQTDLIEDLLDMSRVISGKIRLDVQRANLADVVQSSVASVRHSAEAKGIHLQLNLQGPAVFVRCDPSRLQQCFWNLLSNAIKFTPGGGEVRVALESTQGHCVVRVTDTGQGITPEFLPHVFERFRQADGTTTRVHGGLGIGLSIVKHLVELHGGCVDAASLGEGRGATFAIHLPCLSESESLSPEAAFEQLPVNAADHPSLAGLTILVVDDEPDSRVLVRSILEACGARVLVAPSVGEAMSLLKSQRPSILISDIGMPGEDGYDLIRQVRRLTPEEGGRIPAAALTAFARAEDRTRALRAGYQTHIAKPVEPMELTAVIASLAIR